MKLFCANVLHCCRLHTLTLTHTHTDIHTHTHTSSQEHTSALLPYTTLFRSRVSCFNIHEVILCKCPSLLQATHTHTHTHTHRHTHTHTHKLTRAHVCTLALHDALPISCELFQYS